MINNIESNLTEQLLRSQLKPIAPAQQKQDSVPGVRKTDSSGKTFSELLDAQAPGGIVFSKHAQKRLSSREINMGEKEMSQLKEVMGKLESKGAKESLVLMQNEKHEDFALVVSVKNRTVITALTDKMMKDNIFTNIDSTVVLRNV
jgi:flagellar operon protein